MNLKDFLMDNYIYIIVVIVLIIITIIGFLADKKKTNSKKQTLTDGNTKGYDPNAGGQIIYQPNNNMATEEASPIPNNGAMNFQMNNNTSPMVNQMNQPVQNNIGVIPQPMNGINYNQANINQPSVANAPQPVEPVNNTMINPEPIYQPLSEQSNLSNNIGGVQTSQPLPFNEPQSVVNGPMNTPNDLNQQINSFGAIPQQQVTPLMGQNNISQPLNNVLPTPEQQPMPINNQTSQVNPVPMPGPTENTIPNPITPPQPVNPTPVGFVYGSQPNNNNNNM